MGTPEQKLIYAHCTQARWTHYWSEKVFRASLSNFYLYRQRNATSSGRATLAEIVYAAQQYHACARQYLVAADEHELERLAAGVMYFPRKRRNGASWEDEQHRMYCYSFYYSALLKIAIGINVEIPDRPCDHKKRRRLA